MFSFLSSRNLFPPLNPIPIQIKAMFYILSLILESISNQFIGCIGEENERSSPDIVMT
jgi:hypothetical protein